MILFALFLVLVGIVVSIRKKSIFPFIEMAIYSIPVFLFGILKSVFKELYSHWSLTLLVPFLIVLGTLYLSDKLVKKLDFKY